MSKDYKLTANYVPALTGEIVSADRDPITSAEAQLMQQGRGLAEIAMSGHIGQSRADQSDTAVTHAQAHLIAALPQVLAIGGVVTGLVMIAGLSVGGSAWLWIGIEIGVFGIGALIALVRGRREGLQHTPAGVERHEIDARTQIAMFAIDRHCEALERLKGVRE
jgi:hypothetical protein